jgi:hypothetical protein
MTIVDAGADSNRTIGAGVSLMAEGARVNEAFHRASRSDDEIRKP